MSWIERSMKSNLAFPQPCNMLSFLSLVISCIEFFISCFQNSSSVTVFKETHWPLVCLITAVCVCVRDESWSRVWLFLLSLALALFEGRGRCHGPRVSSSISCFLKSLYRFCTSFLFASCWDWKLKPKPRWRFRTARRNSAVSFKKIKKEVCWWLRDPDIRSSWKHTAGEHDCDVSGSLRCQLSLCNLVSSVSIFPIILIYDYDWYILSVLLSLLITCCLTQIYWLTFKSRSR